MSTQNGKCVLCYGGTYVYCGRAYSVVWLYCGGAYSLEINKLVCSIKLYYPEAIACWF